MAWNRSLPINQLPTELLVSIFAPVAATMSTEEPYLDRDPKWTKLVKVCHHWRDVACASPVLWRTIAMRSAGYTQRALALSNPATVDAFFVRCDSIPQVLNIQLLRPHVHRLRLLSFQVIERSWSSAAFSLLQGDAGMPALETLEFPPEGVSQNPREDDFENVQFTSQRFPRLRFLTIALTTVPHRYALAASTGLESLELISTLQRIQGDWVHWQDAVPGRLVNPISLQYLKSLSLVHHPPVYTSQFLSHVLLSPTVSICIIGDPEDVDETAVSETVSAMLPPNPSPHHPRPRSGDGRIHQRVRTWTRNALSSDIRRVTSGPTHQRRRRPSPSGLSTPLPTLSQLQHLIHGAARDLLTVFKSAPLTTLALKGACGVITAETWTALFSRFPLLETLALASTDGTSESVFAGLMHANTTPGPAPSPPVACPGLRCIRFAGEFGEGPSM
uniref:G protein beta subunit (G protein beta subunit 1) n=1 Tax=Ganoderma boninense TaxID=34458 RepID=A0A5K1JY75_9APHY|nr:G protein beta subunit (G protein beta subunit 1) [Ganoderma boninense]